MDYLEKLRKQAEEKRTAEMQNEEQRARLERIYREQVLPAQEKLFRFLHEVTEHLNYLKPDVVVEYNIRRCRKLGFRPVEYIIRKTDRKNHDFFLRIVYSYGKKLRLETPSKEETELQKDFLWNNNIPFDYEQRNDNRHNFSRGIFHLKGEVYAELNFSAELEASAIKVRVSNFQVFGKHEYLLPPESVDDEFLNQLGEMLTHVPEAPDFIKRYEVANFWMKKKKSPEQLRREQILREIRQKQEAERQREEEEKKRRQQEEKKANRRDEESSEDKKSLRHLFKR